MSHIVPRGVPRCAGNVANHVLNSRYLSGLLRGRQSTREVLTQSPVHTASRWGGAPSCCSLRLLRAVPKVALGHCSQVTVLTAGMIPMWVFNPLNPELNPICYLLALLGAHHFLHVRWIRVKSLTIRLLMSYIHGAPILDVSRSYTTTHHSR